MKTKNNKKQITVNPVHLTLGILKMVGLEKEIDKQSFKKCARQVERIGIVKANKALNSKIPLTIILNLCKIGRFVIIWDAIKLKIRALGEGETPILDILIQGEKK